MRNSGGGRILNTARGRTRHHTKVLLGPRGALRVTTEDRSLEVALGFRELQCSSRKAGMTLMYGRAVRRVETSRLVIISQPRAHNEILEHLTIR